MIDAATLGAIKDHVALHGADEETLKSLRESWSGLHFTYCMDDDVGALDPYLEADGFNLYLVSGRDHCITFTRDPEAATGVVVAAFDPEDS